MACESQLEQLRDLDLQIVALYPNFDIFLSARVLV